MQGMSAKTGKTMEGLDHLVQSITDIITTRVGSRVMRRDYGCRLTDVIDYPANGTYVLRLYAAVAHALLLWEPRLRVTRIQTSPLEAEQGKFTIELKAVLKDRIAEYAPGEEIDLAVPVGN